MAQADQSLPRRRADSQTGTVGFILRDRFNCTPIYATSAISHGTPLNQLHRAVASGGLVAP
jgi:hypothetical protein